MGTRKGTETTDKGEMIAWEIKAKRALASSVPNNSRAGHSPENHADAGTTHTPERLVITRTVHIRTGMITEDQIHQRNSDPTMLPWTL